MSSPPKNKETDVKENIIIDVEQENRLLMTRAVMGTLDSWGLNAESCFKVLCLPDKIPTRMLRRYRDDTPFPDDEDLNLHIDHVIGIAEALRTTYPRNIQMAARWMSRPHRRFNKKSPLSVILKDGLSGLINVRIHLDCAFSWQHTS